MTPDPKSLLDIAGITTPLMGFYDVEDPEPFRPFTEPDFCIFSAYENWLKGESTCISGDNAGAFGCPGAGYWTCGIESVPRQEVAGYLAGQEGLKSSPEVMCQWLDNHPPYTRKFSHVVISELRKDQYEHLKTITFYVNPDQLALLITGAEYMNSSGGNGSVSAPYGSGCGLLAAMFDDLSVPKAIISSTDIAMREHLPQGIMSLTVTKPLFEQLCRLGENSFLYKSFWKKLRTVRGENLSA